MSTPGKQKDRMLLVDEEWDADLGLAHQRTQDIRGILSVIEIFSALTQDELRQVGWIVHLRSYLPNEVIVEQGAPGVGMYIIQSGSADVILEVAEGEVIKLATLGERQFFGEMSLLDGAPRAASVVAVERTRVIGFFRADLMDLIERHPRLGLKIVLQLSRLMGQRLRETLNDFRAVQQTLRMLQAKEPKGSEVV